jgi:predicted permease
MGDPGLPGLAGRGVVILLILFLIVGSAIGGHHLLESGENGNPPPLWKKVLGFALFAPALYIIVLVNLGLGGQFS